MAKQCKSVEVDVLLDVLVVVVVLVLVDEEVKVLVDDEVLVLVDVDVVAQTSQVAGQPIRTVSSVSQKDLAAKQSASSYIFSVPLPQ